MKLLEHVTILDLGVVRDKSNPGLTKPGAMVGTPYYMSPEQILGTAEIDRRTDVYALGAVIFELLTGTPPFVADSNFEVLYKHRTLVVDVTTRDGVLWKDAPTKAAHGIGGLAADEFDD